MHETQPFVDFTKELAQASGDIITRYFRAGVDVDHKSDDSPVTIADRESEQIMRGMIQQRFPEHGIIGEEFEHHQPDAPYQWVLDPIDGTKSFISGTFLFGTLIALLHENQPLVGAIHHPVNQQLLIGTGDETRLNDEIVRVRDCQRIEHASVLCSYVCEVAEYRDMDAFNELICRAKLFRTWGDCHGYFLVGTGYADVMLDPVMNFWDVAALVPIIQGAGGRITNWHGGDPLAVDGIIATAGPLHDEIVALLNP
jgi:myo-inositol-1(or 4)-monophosphatase